MILPGLCWTFSPVSIVAKSSIAVLFAASSLAASCLSSRRDSNASSVIWIALFPNWRGSEYFSKTRSQFCLALLNQPLRL
jgi:hypothetical protein